ncbi:Hypothetical protein GbCGDNIH7_0309 [Granulibacter bethesdensis]|nr:Hypothetical protein GbCGDNIH7_0309 [Granulibacter bethesdensis]
MPCLPNPASLRASRSRSTMPFLHRVLPSSRHPWVTPGCLLVLMLAAASGLGGCKLVDRTTFGAVPAKPPPSALMSALNSEGRIPLLTIRYDGYDEADRSYTDALRTAVQQANISHPGIFYVVTTVVPATGNPTRQIGRAKAARMKAVTVAEDMMLMGVDSDQISLAAMTDPAIQASEIRIFVKRGQD